MCPNWATMSKRRASSSCVKGTCLVNSCESALSRHCFAERKCPCSSIFIETRFHRVRARGSPSTSLYAWISEKLSLVVHGPTANVVLAMRAPCFVALCLTCCVCVCVCVCALFTCACSLFNNRWIRSFANQIDHPFHFFLLLIFRHMSANRQVQRRRWSGRQRWLHKQHGTLKSRRHGKAVEREPLRVWWSVNTSRSFVASHCLRASGAAREILFVFCCVWFQNAVTGVTFGTSPTSCDMRAAFSGIAGDKPMRVH